MTAVAIRAESLSKSYAVSRTAAGGTLREVLSAWPGALLRRLGRRERFARGGILWALRDVSFELRQGEVVGIVGRNGAGKSTLLKLLSRVTEPTQGRAWVRGRVGSLLEAGAGFHPDLTGHENVYLSGAILGMKRTEIARKFDEIVAFADIERFIDTPVKRYSSGMYARLAFAVASHFEPEILMVDEVLAVGDALFQKKCAGKMSEIARTQGRTILLVSHNISATEKLCDKLLWLEHGQVMEFTTDVRSVIRRYSGQDNQHEGAAEWINASDNFQDPRFIPRRLCLLDPSGQLFPMPPANDGAAWVQIEGHIAESDAALQVGYAIRTEDGLLLYSSFHTDAGPEQCPVLGSGPCVLRSKFPLRLLNEGAYRIELIARIGPREWIIEPGDEAPALHLSIRGGLSDSPFGLGKRPGLLAPVLEWVGGARGDRRGR